jgi:hypothetical protein
MIHLPLFSTLTCSQRRSLELKRFLSTSPLIPLLKKKTNHQLHRRIRHLEHNLRDITTHYSAERERHMSLEALVRGKIFILI